MIGGRAMEKRRGAGRGYSGADGPRGVRDVIERRSATLLVFLYRLPRTVLLIAVFTLLAVGMVGTGWPGATALLALAAFLAWFGYLNWPALGISGRLLRIAGVGILVALAVGHIVEEF